MNKKEQLYKDIQNIILKNNCGMPECECGMVGNLENSLVTYITKLLRKTQK